MNSLGEVRHDALIKPIPCQVNLANVTDQQPNATCDFCALIVPDRKKAQNGRIKTGYERVDLYPDFPELKASAKVGCNLCRLIRKTIRKTWAVRPMEEWGVGPIREKDGLWDELLDAPWDRKVRIHKVTFNLETVAGKSEDGMFISLGLEFGPATPFVSQDTDFQYGEIGQALSFKVFDSQDLRGRKEESRRRLPSVSTLSITNLEMISKWVDECKSSHSTCRLLDSPWYPTRLLDVGTLNGTELPRLVETAEEGIEEPYAALSHMWGDLNEGHAPPVRTLKANYEEMKSGIRRQMLSKNFVDAVICARRLGLRYIWIDSLCIVQDSSEDWQKEASTMDKVYKFAEITIVATSAISANDGFLERQLSTIPAVMVGYSLGNPTKAVESMILCEQDDSDTGNWSSDIEGSLWNKRGWTLQERSVSTRMLHFCKAKLYFECRCCLKSEENEPLERYKPRTFEMWPRGDDEKFQVAQLRDPKTETERREGLYKRWIRTVTEYSQRRLTKENDRLVAINAVAEEMSTSVDDAYIPYAGMWVRQLHRDLLWQGLGRPRSTTHNDLAPSWSWASLDAGIQWEAGIVNATPSNRPLPRSTFRVIDVANPIKVSDSSVVHCHFLKAKAFLKPIAFILECDPDDRWITGSRFKFPYDVFIPKASTAYDETLDSLVSVLSLAERNLSVEAGDFLQFAEARLDLDDIDDLTKSRRSLCYLHVNRARPSGLILEALIGSPATWKRVGVATVFNFKTGDLFVDPLFAENELLVEVTII